jgi:glutathione S-transferase
MPAKLGGGTRALVRSSGERPGPLVALEPLSSALDETPHARGGTMSLKLHYHPLSSFCQKALVALYELEVPFEPHLVDLGDPAARAAFVKLWPIGKFPVLEDTERNEIVPESSIIVEWLERRHAGARRLVPVDPDEALECRLRDRFFDLHIHTPMQKIVGDRLRPDDRRDPLGVEHARAGIETAYGVADQWLGAGPWALGERFSLADCAAAPALYYANRVVPFERHPRVAAYFARLAERPSYARVLEEAKPYLSMFPA